MIGFPPANVAWRDAVTVAALDAFQGYATALSSLTAALRLLDAFPVTRLAYAAVDDVRRRMQQESTGHAAASTTRCIGFVGC